MLLSAAARREELVAGKVLATMTATGVSAILSVSSFAITFYAARSAGADMFARMGDLPLDLPTFVLIVISLLPMIVLTAAVSMAVATPARSTKEAMSYMTPVVMISVFLGIFSTLPGIELGQRAALIPVANFCWLLKQLLQGEWSWTAFGLTMAANCVYAGIAFYAVLRRFRDEAILFRA
jgi:sodium transport system permease protein